MRRRLPMLEVLPTDSDEQQKFSLKSSLAPRGSPLYSALQHFEEQHDLPAEVALSCFASVITKNAEQVSRVELLMECVSLLDQKVTSGKFRWQSLPKYAEYCKFQAWGVSTKHRRENDKAPVSIDPHTLANNTIDSYNSFSEVDNEDFQKDAACYAWMRELAPAFYWTSIKDLSAKDAAALLGDTTDNIYRRIRIEQETVKSALIHLWECKLDERCPHCEKYLLAGAYRAARKAQVEEDVEVFAQYVLRGMDKAGKSAD